MNCGQAGTTGTGSVRSGSRPQRRGYDGTQPGEDAFQIVVGHLRRIQPEVVLNNLPQRLDCLLVGTVESLVFEVDFARSLDDRARGGNSGRGIRLEIFEGSLKLDI
jgi:hypothetical protein